MGIITAPHFVLIAIVGFFAVVWSLVSMGVIKTRDHSLHAENAIPALLYQHLKL